MIKNITVLTGGQYTYRLGMKHKRKTIGMINEVEDNIFDLYDENNVLISTVKSNSVEIEYD